MELSIYLFFVGGKIRLLLEVHSRAFLNTTWCKKCNFELDGMHNDEKAFDTMIKKVALDLKQDFFFAKKAAFKRLLCAKSYNLISPNTGFSE